jgi:hypothetical protein
MESDTEGTIGKKNMTCYYLQFSPTPTYSILLWTDVENEKRKQIQEGSLSSVFFGFNKDLGTDLPATFFQKFSRSPGLSMVPINSSGRQNSLAKLPGILIL